MKLAACCCTRRCSVVCSGAVALVVDRGAIGRPHGLPADGLHARLPRWWPVPSQAVWPHAATQSPRVSPTCVCPPLRGILWGPPRRHDRQLRGAEFRAADVAEGSIGPVHRRREQSLVGPRHQVAHMLIRAAGNECQVQRYSGQPSNGTAKVRYRQPLTFAGES